MYLKKIQMLIISLLMFSLASCTSSTNMGTTGIKRKQLLLLPSAQMNAMAAKAYAGEVYKAQVQNKLDNNPKQYRRVKNIANRIISKVDVFRPDAKKWDWEVHVTDSDVVNAYAAPGGKIMFFSGIIEKLELTDDEIAAIMGHEVAHALREHSRESASRKYATNMGFGILASSVGLTQGQAQIAGIINQFGLTLPHNRSQESEADVLGLELAARAGYDPNAAVTVWQKMQSRGGRKPPEFMSTHPSNASRIRKLKSMIATVMPLYNQTQNNSFTNSKTKSKSYKKSKTKKSSVKRKFKKYQGD